MRLNQETLAEIKEQLEVWEAMGEDDLTRIFGTLLEAYEKLCKESDDE